MCKTSNKKLGVVLRSPEYMGTGILSLLACSGDDGEGAMSSPACWCNRTNSASSWWPYIPLD